jgi:hypothetical protein
MKRFVFACCVVLSLSASESAQKQQIEPHADQAQSANRSTPFDPSTQLASRITFPPDSIRQQYRELPKPTPEFHELTAVERTEVESVLTELPAFTRQVFTQHVRSISFVDGRFGNATTVMEPGSTLPIFDIVLRAGLLNENVSEFLTRKERGYYTATDSGPTLSIEAGSLPAVLYVLLHESVHVLDISNRAGQAGPPRLLSSSHSDQLVRGIWEGATDKVPAYRSPLFEVSWFGAGKPENIEAAEPTYRFLASTPFVSLYGSSNWYDDAAELVTCYYLTQKLQQPYRIVLSRGTETLYSLSPMDGALVRARFPQIMPLFG